MLSHLLGNLWHRPGVQWMVHAGLPPSRGWCTFVDGRSFLLESYMVHVSGQVSFRMDLNLMTLKDLIPFDFILTLNPQVSRAVFSLTIGPCSLTLSYYHYASHLPPILICLIQVPVLMYSEQINLLHLHLSYILLSYTHTYLYPHSHSHPHNSQPMLLW